MSTYRIARPTLFLVTALVLMAIPTLLIVGVGWKSAAIMAALCAISAVFNALSMGWRALWWATPFTTVSVFLAVVVSANPWAAAVAMLAIGAGMGLANKRGLTAGNLMLPMVVAATIGTPPTITHNVPLDALISAVIAGGSMLIAGGILMILLRKKDFSTTNYPHYSTKVTGVYTFNLAVLLAGVGYFSAAQQAQVQGMWLALTVVLVVQPYIYASVRRGFERAGGTVLGFLISMGVASAVADQTFFALIGLLFIELAILTMMNAKDSYWLYVMFLTPGVVLTTGPPAQVSQFADWRLLVTLIAVAACLVLLGLERLLFFKGSLNKAPEVHSLASTPEK